MLYNFVIGLNTRFAFLVATLWASWDWRPLFSDRVASILLILVTIFLRMYIIARAVIQDYIRHILDLSGSKISELASKYPERKVWTPRLVNLFKNDRRTCDVDFSPIYHCIGANWHQRVAVDSGFKTSPYLVLASRALQLQMDSAKNVSIWANI